MGTVTITSAGYAALGGAAPDNWPGNLVWPPTGSINGTKVFTISDADAQQMLAWIAANYNAEIVAGSPPPGTPGDPVTAPAIGIILAWLKGFMNATTDAVQRHHMTEAALPPPITIS